MSNYYNRNAKLLFEKYQSLNPASLHAHWLKHVPLKPGLALDVGAGSGRDATWLAQKGWEVIAVEPAQALRALGKKATEAHVVKWVDDCLPELTNIQTYRQQFSLILVSGILMHLSQEQRDASMQTLANFMAEKSVLVVTLRQGPDSEGRNFNQVSADEMIQFAKKRSFQVEAGDAMPDKLGRDSVVWQTIVLTKGGVAE
jgi:2-polyprenyl-3-methyl-5-hydroxy-6-metoxy-1,4-benzoquinol methylase